MQLAELEFIDHTANRIFIGPTGMGKTGLASNSRRHAPLRARS
jgi:type IV secretory pathway ATPase VirB11/archaellum biosynthesis ATPase